MGLRFRKSIKLLPGVRVNMGLKGASLSVGPRGASMSFGKQGTFTNVSIPGTGISFRNKVGSNSKQNERLLKQQQKELEQQNNQVSNKSIQLSLHENGTISYKDEFGLELSRSDISKVWKQKSDIVTKWLEEEAMKINDMDLITTIHLDMPNPDNEPSIEIIEFSEPKPEKPEKQVVQKPSFFQNIFSSKAKSKYISDLQNAENNFIKEISLWENNLKEWENKKYKHDEHQQYLKGNFDVLIREDANTMFEYLEKVYQGLNWPRETLISYDLDNEKSVIYLDVDLPEIEDIPQRVVSIASTGKKLNIKNKSEKQLRLEYAMHIHAIALRIAAYTFATLPSINLAVLSGYSQRLDKSIAKINDEYLYSIKFDRDNLSKINFYDLENLDPISAFENFEHLRSMTKAFVFKPIEPFSTN